MTKLIPIKYKNESHFAIVDDEDFERLSAYKWYLWKQDDKLYTFRYVKVGPKKTNKGRKKYRTRYMHHDVLPRVAGLINDHKDGNGLNCTRDNLRHATYSQNCANRGPAKNCTSGYKGVQRSKKKWSARIKINRVSINIGVYETPELAAVAYDVAALKYFGEFAYLNFKTPPSQGSSSGS